MRRIRIAAASMMVAGGLIAAVAAPASAATPANQACVGESLSALASTSRPMARSGPRLWGLLRPQVLPTLGLVTASSSCRLGGSPTRWCRTPATDAFIPTVGASRRTPPLRADAAIEKPPRGKALAVRDRTHNVEKPLLDPSGGASSRLGASAAKYWVGDVEGERRDGSSDFGPDRPGGLQPLV